ncbi:MAG: hypothetical protein KDG89_05060, partial [Geminicoccaceae bacterium]|nr:hypothetical protein [Geminicoccaceae bacterium]
GEAARAPSAGPPAAGTDAVGAVPSLYAMLAVQGVDDALEERRRAKRHGGRLLDELDVLHEGLLDGRIPADLLPRLRRYLGEERGRTDDPALARTIDEIELRVQVEMAKLERDGLASRTGNGG